MPSWFPKRSHPLVSKQSRSQGLGERAHNRLEMVACQCLPRLWRHEIRSPRSGFCLFVFVCFCFVWFFCYRESASSADFFPEKRSPDCRLWNSRQTKIEWLERKGNKDTRLKITSFIKHWRQLDYRNCMVFTNSEFASCYKYEGSIWSSASRRNMVNA